MVSEKELINSLQNYFRSEDLARMADVIFSETVSVDDFNNRNLNAFIIHKNKDYMTYILKNFKLNDGDVIFCNSDYLEVLFKSLKNKKIKNLVPSGLAGLSTGGCLAWSTPTTRREPRGRGGCASPRGQRGATALD